MKKRQVIYWHKFKVLTNLLCHGVWSVYQCDEALQHRADRTECGKKQGSEYFPNQLYVG